MPTSAERALQASPAVATNGADGRSVPAECGHETISTITPITLRQSPPPATPLPLP